MKPQQISGTTLIQFIRVLGELNAAGLTAEQFHFLNKSAELTPEEVRSILQAADAAYETIKDLVSEGYRVIHPGSTLTSKNIEAACIKNDGIVQAIVFPGDDELGLNEYSEATNSLFECLLVGNQVSTGETAGLEYNCLFSELPFIASVDIPEETCCKYLETND